MNLKNDLFKKGIFLKKVLDGEDTLDTADETIKEFEKFSALGEKIDISNVSEEPEASKIPIRSEDDSRVEHEEIRIINPNFPLPHGMKIYSLRATGSITIGNKYVNIDIGLAPNMCIMGAQAKCLAAAGIGAGNYWHAKYYFNAANLQSIDKTDYIDAVGIGFESPFDVNAASAVCPTGTLRIRVDLDVNATTQGEYDVVVYILDFVACDTS